ncbi:MAG: tRNA-dihydrouridine synthase, partial [Polaromonas sp.]
LVAEVKRLLLDHLLDHYALYGEFTGVRTARKHIGWYVKTLPGGEAFRAQMNLLEDCVAQLQAVGDFFEGLGERMDRIPASQGSESGPAQARVSNDKSQNQNQNQNQDQEEAAA